MRIWRLIPVLFTVSGMLAADFPDLGVPRGWSANEYDDAGLKLLNKGEYENARHYFNAAIRLEPERWGAYYNRAISYNEQKNWRAGLQDLNTTIRLKPTFLQASMVRTRVYEYLGDYQAALRDMRAIANAAVVVNTGTYSEVLNSRAWLRAVCRDPSVRDGKLAVTDAKHACDLSKWKHAAFVDTLAAACAEAGDFDAAIRYQEQAISLCEIEPDQTRRELARQRYSKGVAKKLGDENEEDIRKSLPGYRERLALYEAHRPYRESLAE